jgi:hypothetical protein
MGKTIRGVSGSARQLTITGNLGLLIPWEFIPVCLCLLVRYLRPGDSLPVGVCDADVTPIALPDGWREKYAGLCTRRIYQ